MKVEIVTKRLEEAPADALVVGLHVGEAKLPERLARLDRAAQGQLKRVLDAEKFSGKAGSVTHAHADGRRIVVAGLGPRADTTA
ncbi:MAG TPA: M17 family peptidase N-terminal domain-containing protein, partial [Methylomirabilota bacterium]|nr:M17 family peptidase N-terminal domain-containing protein [Methylomirabilota bacterium]